MKQLFMLIGLLTAGQPVLASLPPYYQSVREMTAILDSPAVAGKIGSPYSIDSLVRNKNGYQLEVGDCQLNIKVHYLPYQDGMVGPAEFTIEPGEKVCKPS